MKKVIGFFKSIRLAAALILFIAVLSLIGIFIPQIPSYFSATPDGYAQWVENVAYSQLGDIVYTIEPLGFFNIFRSFWFIGAVSLLMLNILVCTIIRIKSLKAESKKTNVNIETDFYKQGKYVYEFETALSMEQMGETVSETLEDRHYSAAKEESKDTVYFAGDKRRYSSWGTLPVHLSLILLLAGVLVGSLFGFKDDSFVVAEGTGKDIGNGTGLTVYLKSFTDEYWDDGTPKDYRSDVEIYSNGEKVKSGIVRVNHPVVYQGVRIHQGYFGQAAGLEISDAEGNVLYKDNVALTGMRVNDSLHRPEGEVTLSENKYYVYILGSAINGDDPYIGKDQIGIEFYNADMNFLGWLLLDENTSQQLGGLYFNYVSLQYSGFLVSKDPGAPFIWAAALLFLTGLGMIFYFPHRRIWVRINKGSKNSSIIAVKTDARKEPGLESESIKIIQALGFKEKTEGSKKN